MSKETYNPDVMPDPPYVQTLLSSTRFAWLWTIIRVYVGWSWLTAGWGKVNNPAWTQTGVAVRGFWTAATTVTEGSSPTITYDWYRNFLSFLLEGEHYVW